MDFLVRAAAPSDARSIVLLGREIDRDQIADVASFRKLLERGAEPNVERLVADSDGHIVAWAPSGTYASGDGWFWIGVERSQRRRGVGGGLYARIEERLAGRGATRLETTPNDDDGRRFLIDRGFEVTNVVTNSELDPRTVEAAPPQPDSIRVAALAEASGQVDALFRLYSEARADVPSATPRPEWTYDEWRRETIDSPLIDLDASVVVLEEDEPVALAWL